MARTGGRLRVTDIEPGEAYACRNDGPFVARIRLPGGAFALDAPDGSQVQIAARDLEPWAAQLLRRDLREQALAHADVVRAIPGVRYVSVGDLLEPRVATEVTVIVDLDFLADVAAAMKLSVPADGHLLAVQLAGYFRHNVPNGGVNVVLPDGSFIKWVQHAAELRLPEGEPQPELDLLND